MGAVVFVAEDTDVDADVNVDTDDGYAGRHDCLLAVAIWVLFPLILKLPYLGCASSSLINYE